MVSMMVLPPARDDPPAVPSHAAHRWPRAIGAAALLVSVLAFWIWASDADKREIRSLPDRQRLALFQRTLDDLQNSCDPAPPRSLRDFCHRQAELALKFRECDTSPRCQELARRHLLQPRR